MRELVVAAVQATPVPGAIAGNATRGADLARRAGGARVVVLPELFLSAYHPPTLAQDETAWVVAAEDTTVDDPRLDPLREAAHLNTQVIVTGAAVRHADGRGGCSILVIGPDGSTVVGYDKQLLWGPDERALFTPGEHGSVVVVDEWRLGLGICYDGCFPEHARGVAAAGAYGCLYPSGYLDGSAHRRDVYYAARALDNTMYVVFANSVGAVGAYRFNGGAAVYDPQGRPVGRGADEGEAVVVATLDPDEVVRVRGTHTMLADRPEATLVASREVTVG